MRRPVEPNATIVRRRDLTEAIMSLWIRPDAPVHFAAGQYLSLGVRVGGRLVQRPYSPASGPADPEIELLIRHVRGGELTSRLWNVRDGARVHLGPAKGLFRLRPDDHRDHLLVATGTGIAPVVAMIGELSRRPQPPAIAVFHGVAHRRELAFEERLETWAGTADRFRYLPAVSRPDDVANEGWSGRAGRLTNLLPDLLREVACAPTRTVAYLCGNPAVVSGIGAGLAAQGVPADAIHSEEYWPLV